MISRESLIEKSEFLDNVNYIATDKGKKVLHEYYNLIKNLIRSESFIEKKIVKINSLN